MKENKKRKIGELKSELTKISDRDERDLKAPLPEQKFKTTSKFEDYTERKIKNVNRIEVEVKNEGTLNPFKRIR